MGQGGHSEPWFKRPIKLLQMSSWPSPVSMWGGLDKVMDPEKHCLHVAPNEMLYPSPQHSPGGHSSCPIPGPCSNSDSSTGRLQYSWCKIVQAGFRPQLPTTATENDGWECLRQLAPQGWAWLCTDPQGIRRNAQQHPPVASPASIWICPGPEITHGLQERWWSRIMLASL